VLIVLGIGAIWLLTKPAITSEQPTAAATQAATATPAATTSTATSSVPAASTSSSAAPTEVATTGPQSDTPISRVCVGVPTNLHYVGQCKVAGDATLTGRQAFEACIAVAENSLYVANPAYGRKHQDNWDRNKHWCVASIGMSDWGEVYGYPGSDKHSVKYFVIQDAKNNITRLFDGDGLYIPDNGALTRKVLSWFDQFSEGD
jgi:hypothetical protein